jgi:hypothetical protein
MRRCRLALLLLLYVALDFSNPLMPGAVSFDLSESVEGVHAVRPRIEAPSVAIAPLLIVVPEPLPVLVRAAPRPGPVVRAPHHRRVFRLRGALPPPGEDH